MKRLLEGFCMIKVPEEIIARLLAEFGGLGGDMLRTSASKYTEKTVANEAERVFAEGRGNSPRRQK